MEAEGYHIAMQPIQLTPGRFPLPKPYPEDWSIERQIIEACREGNLLLESEIVKAGPPKSSQSGSVKPDPKTAVQDNLAAKSDNPYIKARAKVLGDMTPSKRAQIEKMESDGKIENPTYKAFISAVTALGDKISSTKN